MMPTTARTLSALWPADSDVDGAGRLRIGGCDAGELARTFGTPAYVVAEDDLRVRARAYRDALAACHPDGAGEVIFASKAFPCTAVERVLAQAGLGCDVASGGELHVARQAGFAPERIVAHGNAKSSVELAEALRARVGAIVIDSFDDIERLEGLTAGGRDRRQPVLVRVTPGVRPDTHAKIATGQAGSKFGLDLEAARAAIDRLRAAPGLRLDGLHVHLGSQILDTEPWLEAVRALASLGDFGTYNLGGGLGVVYERERVPPAIETWVRDVVAFAHAELGAAAKRVMLEPGRSLVANAGVTLYTVTTVKPGWVAVDGGMSDNLRPMLYGAPYQAWLAERMTAAPDTACHVAGKHCESGDVLVHDAALPAPRPGDVLVTPATGAYGHAMANNYNGVPRPPVILCADGDAREVVRRETYADLTARDGV